MKAFHAAASILIAGAIAGATGCTQSPPTATLHTGAAPDRHVEFTGLPALNNYNLTDVQAHLPDRIPEADANKLLVMLDPTHIANVDPSYHVQQVFTPLNLYSNYLYYPYGNYYYPYSLNNGYYYPYSYYTNISQYYPYTYSTNNPYYNLTNPYNYVYPFLYNYNSYYYPYTGTGYGAYPGSWMQQYPGQMQNPGQMGQYPAQATQSVTISNYQFNPNILTVTAGTTVTWTNNDPYAHTVTSDPGSMFPFDSGQISPGSTFSKQFTVRGTFAYHCTIHPNMHGTVIVR